MTMRQGCPAAGGRGSDRGCICRSPVSLARITRCRAQLLALIAAYRTNAEIARDLNLTEWAVKRAVETLREITGCRSKARLAHWWALHEPLWRATLGGRR